MNTNELPDFTKIIESPINDIRNEVKMSEKEQKRRGNTKSGEITIEEEHRKTGHKIISCGKIEAYEVCEGVVQETLYQWYECKNCNEVNRLNSEKKPVKRLLNLLDTLTTK